MRSGRLFVQICIVLLIGAIGMISLGEGRIRAAETPGLSIDARGVIVKDGRPYRGIGVNFFEAFLRTLSDPATTSYRDGFEVLSAHKIRYARVILGGFFPSDFQQYINNKASYFQRMDGVIQAAEENQVGIIASLFWNNFVCADLAGEHMDAYDDPNSKSYAFMRQYINDVVGRYKDSPAIWGWECGNEYILFNDLSNGASFLPTEPAFGCPTTRDPVRDNFPHERTNKLLAEFAKAVRAIDPYRIIESGNSEPRGSAWHLDHYDSWDMDTKAQFTEVLVRDNPDPLNVISVHAYAGTEKEFFSDQPVKTFSGLMAETRKAGATVNKPIFLGEFSTPSYLPPEYTQPNPNEHAQFNELIAAIEDNKIPLSAVWTFGRWSGYGPDASYDIEDNNARGYMLDLIEAANERIQNQLLEEQSGVKECWALYR